MNQNLGVVLIEQHKQTINFSFLFIPGTEVDPKDIVTALLVYLQQMLKRDVIDATGGH